MAAEARAERLDRARVTNQQEALDLANAILDTLSSLAQIIGEETQLMKDGKIAEALEREIRKTELAGLYMRGLETVKANAVALARFAPDEIQRLKVAHLEFGELLQTNQAVLATARAVSETIVRDLAKDAGRTSQPQGYGVSGYGAVAPAQQPRSTGPMVISKSL